MEAVNMKLQVISTCRVLEQQLQKSHILKRTAGLKVNIKMLCIVNYINFWFKKICASLNQPQPSYCKPIKYKNNNPF